ncbi:MAG: hypothetical protein AB1646_22110 [Thermodesulfobacteriota bacterium]
MDFVSEHTDAFLTLLAAGVIAIMTINEMVNEKNLGFLMIGVPAIAALKTISLLDILGVIDQRLARTSMNMIMGITLLECAAIGLTARPASQSKRWSWLFLVLGVALLQGALGEVREWWW